MSWHVMLQAGLMATHSVIVSQISQEMNGRYLALQKQHQEFAAHLNGQIASLEHQLMMQSLYQTWSCFSDHLAVAV